MRSIKSQHEFDEIKRQHVSHGISTLKYTWTHSAKKNTLGLLGAANSTA